MADWVPIIPGAGDSARDVAVLLLSLADRPEDVRTARGGSEFLVAPYVAERFTSPADPEPSPRRRTRKKEGS